MHDPTKIDYSKLLGFDMVANDAADGVDFKDTNIGARLGAKVGKTTQTSAVRPMPPTDLPSEVTRAAGPIMQGLGGRTITGS